MASEFPTQARVVIIGGGVGGCSIAYHLTKMGWKDVVVLERGELTCGSTWHSAGLVGQLRSDFNLTRMMKYSTDLYRTLKDETGIDTGWREVGGLRLASSAERMGELKRQVGYARSFGMPLEMISTEDAHRMWPLMNPQGVLGAVFTPTDGSIDPTGLTNALAAGAKNGGARFFTDTVVSGIGLTKGRVDQVVTDRGSIRTEIVVNAAGQWGNEVARMVGVTLPIIPFAHLYLITKPIEGLDHDVPTMRDGPTRARAAAGPPSCSPTWTPSASTRAASAASSLTIASAPRARHSATMARACDSASAASASLWRYWIAAAPPSSAAAHFATSASVSTASGVTA